MPWLSSALAGAGPCDTVGVAGGARRDDAGLIFGVEGRSGVVDGDVVGVGVNPGGVLAAHRRPCCTTFHSVSKLKKKTGKKSNRATFEWCYENSRIRDVNRYLVFKDMPLEFRNLRYEGCEGGDESVILVTLTSPPPEASSLSTM